MRRQMKLGMFMRAPGHHIAAWRLPESPRHPGNSLAHNVEVAQLAERGLFDMLFWADSVGVWGGDKAELSRLCRVAWIEPFTLLAALAAVTRNIGLVCTSTTTYDEPYHVARRFAPAHSAGVPSCSSRQKLPRCCWAHWRRSSDT